MWKPTKQGFSLYNQYRLKIKGALWNYRGQASMVLFVHGFGGFMSEPQYVALRKALVAQGYAVCTFDQTNSLGHSQKDPATMSYATYFSDVLRVITWLRDYKQVHHLHVVAHSLGGGISIQLMGEGVADMRFLSATLINPLITSQGTMIVQGHPQGWKQTGQVILKRLFKRLTITREAIESMESFNVQTYASVLTTPTFFILGQHDTTIPPAQSRSFVQHMQAPARLVEYPFLGHTFFHANALQHMDTVIYAIMKWIKQHDIQG